jgi:hypothetical protein
VRRSLKNCSESNVPRNYFLAAGCKFAIGWQKYSHFMQWPYTADFRLSNETTFSPALTGVSVPGSLALPNVIFLK